MALSQYEERVLRQLERQLEEERYTHPHFPPSGWSRGVGRLTRVLRGVGTGPRGLRAVRRRYRESLLTIAVVVGLVVALAAVAASLAIWAPRAACAGASAGAGLLAGVVIVRYAARRTPR